MSGLTQQRLGAQQQAAGQVAAKRAEFTQVIASIEAQGQTLLGSYRGAGARAFSTLIAEWLTDARRIVAEFDDFAARLTLQDSTTGASQDEQVGIFHAAISPLATRLG